MNVDRWSDWGPSVRAVVSPTERIALGTRGTIETIVRARLSFEITEFEPGRSWSWRVGGVDATTHTVEAVAGGTRVTFGVPALAAPYVLVCVLALRRIEHLALEGAC